MSKNGPKKPAEDTPDELICVRDQTQVSAEDPRCLHPSTVCQFRELCEVIEARRRQRCDEPPQPPHE